MKKVNLLITIDRNYILPSIIMIDSYKKSHPQIYTEVFIAHSALTENDINFISSATQTDYLHVSSIYITEKWFTDTPVIERLPQESFFRLMAFQYLPRDMERCLYIDPDVYINNNLLPLYNLDMGSNYIVAASHLRGLHNKINILRLGMKETPRYINSGVMLMNLHQIRKDFTVNKITDSLDIYSHLLLLGDQDLINIIFDGKIYLVDETIYNLDEKTVKKNKHKIDKSYITNKTVIIHYNGKYKPWLKGYKGILDRYYPYIENKATMPKRKIRLQIKSVIDIVTSFDNK